MIVLYALAAFGAIHVAVYVFLLMLFLGEMAVRHLQEPEDIRRLYGREPS